MLSETVRSNVTAIANASFSSDEVGRVGIFLASNAASACSASAREILLTRAAFQRMLPNSGQNRSGTRNRSSPFAYFSRSPEAASVSVSPAEGRNHFAATLASRTSVVNGGDPRAAFLPLSANRPLRKIVWRGFFARAAVVPYGDRVQPPWGCSPRAWSVLRPQWNVCAGALAPEGLHTVRPECFRRTAWALASPRLSLASS